MRQMTFKKLFVRSCEALLGALGVCSCDSIEEIITGADEYGVPYSEYEIKGKVVDADSKAPVKGVRVVSLPVRKNADGGLEAIEDPYSGDTVKVNGSGEFVVAGATVLTEGLLSPRLVKVEDLDPDNDGWYATTSDFVEIKKKEDSGGGWNEGKYVADITVEMKVNDEK